MTYRITRKNLEAQLAHAAKAVGWDIAQPIWTPTETGSIARVGAVFLEHHTHYGWRLCQVVNLGGGENVIRAAATAREMYAYLQGVSYAKGDA